MTDSRNATWNQSKVIWSFCARRGNKNANWAGLAKEGALTFERASKIISLMREDDERAAAHIANFLPGFALKGGQAEAGTETKAGTEEAQAEEKGAEEKAKDKSKAKSEVERKMEELKKALEKEAEAKAKGKGNGLAALGVQDDYIKPEYFDKLGALVKAGVNVLLVGPAGCGKSRAAKELAKALGMEFYTFSAGGGIRYSQLFGSTHIKEDGTTAFRLSAFLEAVQRPNTLVLVDEVLGIDPEVGLGLNALFEPSCREVQTPAGAVKVHPSSRLIAAANSTGRSRDRQYTGVQRADDSLLDRFVVLSCGYDAQVEKALLSKAELPGDSQAWFLAKVKGLREAVRVNGIAFDPSTRRLLSAVLAVKAGLSREDAFECAFLATLSVAERQKVSA